MTYDQTTNDMIFSIRLALARLCRVVIANINFSVSSLRKSPLTSLRSIFLISTLFAPVVFYIFFISSSTLPFAPTYYSSFSLSSSASSSSFFQPVDVPPGHIPAPRKTLQRNIGYVPSAPSQDPTVRILFACDYHDPCCDTSFTPALVSALNQTLAPNHLTVLHACTDDQAHRADPFLKSVHNVVSDNFNDSVYGSSVASSDEFVTSHVCALPITNSSATTNSTTTNHNLQYSDNMELCVLRYLASPPSDSPAMKDNSYVLLITPSFILEPTAIESLWLHLFVHPTLAAARPLLYNSSSLYDSLIYGDPLRVEHVLPNTSTHDVTPVRSLPLMLGHNEFSVASAIGRPASTQLEDDVLFHPKNLWLAYAHLISRSRILRIPLSTHIDPIVHMKSARYGISGAPPTPQEPPLLSFQRANISKQSLSPHLWSEHAFYKWSARNDNREKYSVTLNSPDEKNAFDFWGMPFRKIDGANQLNGKPRVMFVMPWIQMGGSEKCMLDVAERLVNLDWSITFILTMPFWHEDPLGEYSLKNEWMGKALSITSDVFDIVSLSPNHKFSKVLRYFVETRSPDYIFTANARIVYEHLSFIKQVSPKTMIADYNHMVHMDWEVAPGYGGGMPRYGATYTESIDLHLTASDNVTTSMKSWIDKDVLDAAPEKVQTCYIGTDPAALHSDDVKPTIRRQMRKSLGISERSIVILFAGRYVADKGIDVMGEVVRRVAQDESMASKLAFVFVGSGEQYEMLEETQIQLATNKPKMIMKPPAVGLDELRNYYAMADIFLLPSNNEGIALVLYEAMAAGLLVMGTDVGGQKELIRTNTGVLLPLLNNVPASASFIVQELQAVTKFPSMFQDVQERGKNIAREKFTTDKFCECVINNMMRAKKDLDAKQSPTAPQEKAINEMRPVVADVMRGERVHGLWNQKLAKRSIESQVTVGIKTYVCDDSIVRQVVGLVRSIRVNYPRVRILLANDGPTVLKPLPGIGDDEFTEEVLLPADSGISVGRNVMVNMTTTEFFVLLDDDHVFDDDTDLSIAVGGIGHYDFDIVGIRVRNLPGIDELERIGIFIPRYVAKISKFENREITLCVWNENNGPGVQQMRVPIQADVLHNALIAKVDTLRQHPWRNILKVNEHMTFFLDNRKAGVKIGYLPSVFVHHRARRYSDCYKKVRFREDKYEQLLEYKDNYLWDGPCGDNFPDAVKQHIEATQHAF